jgi:Tfp pilus assembly protein PilN
MRQQINLYQPIFSRERKQFSAVTVVASLGVLALVLTAFSIHASMGVKQLQGEVARLTEQQAQQQAQFLQVGELHARNAHPAEVEARVKALTTTLNERKQALQVLQSGAAGQTTGFAARMEALARRHVSGLWIDALAMSGTNGSMSLSGGSLDADIVPTYLRSLSGEAVLSGTRFDDFVIERPRAAAEEKTDDEAKPARKVTTIEHVRFHAGSKSLPVKRPGASS